MNRYIANAVAKLDHAYAVFGANPNLGFYGWDERIGAGFENAGVAPNPRKRTRCFPSERGGNFASAMRVLGRQDWSAKYAGYASQKMAALRQNSNWFKTFGMHACADAAGTAASDGRGKGIRFLRSSLRIA